MQFTGGLRPEPHRRRMLLESYGPFTENDYLPSAPNGIGTLWPIVLCTALIPVLSGWRSGVGGDGRDAIRGCSCRDFCVTDNYVTKCTDMQANNHQDIWTKCG